MPTEAETRVMQILSAIEVPPAAADLIESLGTEAVTVVCEAALGSYPGIREKVRTNAVSLLGMIDHPQARETVPLLVNDPNPDVAIRAMRAAGAQRNDDVVPRLDRLLSRPDAPPLLAAEAVKALIAVDSTAARASLTTYAEADSPPAHRDSALVRRILSDAQKSP